MLFLDTVRLARSVEFVKRLDGSCEVATVQGTGAAGVEKVGVAVGIIDGLIIPEIVLLPVVLLIATRCGPPT